MQKRQWRWLRRLSITSTCLDVDSKPIHDGIELLLRGKISLLEYRKWDRILSGNLVIRIDHEPGEKLSKESG